MLLNPVIAMLHNTKAETWHPILFCESPLPGPPKLGKPIRHQSKGHHTSGFASQDEANCEAQKLADNVKEYSIGDVQLRLDYVIPWNGDGIPAEIAFFGERESV